MQKLYGAVEKYEGGFGDVRFYFHAKDQKDADSKIIGWNRYHGMCDEPGWGWRKAVEAQGDVPEYKIHDEWIF